MNIEDYVEARRKQRQGKSYAFLAERCETSAEAPFRMRVAEEVSPQETMVLVLTGTGGTLRGYNGMLKQADNFVKGSETLAGRDVRVCVAVCDFGKYHHDRTARKGMYFEKYWPNHLEELTNGVAEKSRQETFDPAYIHDIFDLAILPRISKDGGKERLSQIEALQNIRRLNIVAHCHSGYTALVLEKLMTAKTAELGYSEQEQKQLKSQLLALCYNPDCPRGCSDLYMVSVESSQDRYNDYNTYIKEMLLMSPKDFGVCYLTKKWGRTLMCAQVDKAGVEGNPKRVYKLVEPEEWFKNVGNPKAPKTLGEHDFMGFEPVSNMSRGALLLQTFANNILKNAVENSLRQGGDRFIPLPKIQNLAADTVLQKSAFAKAAIKGFRLEQKVRFTDRSRIDAYANWRRSIPRVEL